ncbi:Glycoside hydrolase [Macleaya cordata]|uniref:Glycoside hydrolase n=1 Tax=Macleaya cordata TaxID=56857 RepID=A0A200Q7V1_MACCD|nr:Glycoside hydrolase [Macleaya cordata]
MGSRASDLFLRNITLLLFLFVSIARSTSSKSKTFNVNYFGAVADGKRDNSKAFMEAWKEACFWRGKARVLIPKGTYLVGPISFIGPCRGVMVFKVQGVIRAPYGLAKVDEDSWIKFQYIDGLKIGGAGTFDGQGASAWPYNECSKNTQCRTLPVSIRFDFVNNATVQGINSINSKAFHINVFACKNLKFKSVTITAPHDSPNTDGIHIGNSNDITIFRSKIGTGDDCISLGPGSSNIYISRVTCGPGHGISVGSLGKYPNEEDVTGLTVRNCTFLGTTNGVRIKTWAPSPPSVAKNFSFESIFMDKVENPIIIDQQYCPTRTCSHESSSQVQIRDVNFINIWGTSRTKLAVDLSCSRGVPCRNIKLDRIYLPYHGGGISTSSCSNVDGISYGEQIPPSCIS